MKYLVVFAIALCVYTANASMSCVQGTNKTAAATACAGGETKCKGPKFSSYTGFVDSAVAFACGACTTSEAETCEDCDTTGCNSILTKTFKCHKYSYNTTTKEFSMTANVKQSCIVKNATAVMCNMPTSGANITTYPEYSATTGMCGPCASSSTGCSNCTTDSCNSPPSSAVRVAVFSTPLLALFFILL